MQKTPQAAEVNLNSFHAGLGTSQGRGSSVGYGMQQELTSAGDMPRSPTSGKPTLSSNEEEKLNFYITTCSFCLCNSACSLQSLNQVGHVVSERGDLQYQELELISLTLVLLFAIARLLKTCFITPVCVKVRHPPPHLDCCSRAWVHTQTKPLSLNQPMKSQCCQLQSVYKNSVIPWFESQSLEC